MTTIHTCSTCGEAVTEACPTHPDATVDSTRTYTAVIDGGQGGETEIEATDIDDAWEQAVDWVRDGDWDTSEGPAYCDLRVTEVRDAEERTGSVTIPQPEPECTQPATGRPEHVWQSPVALVGGIKENPGVWGHGGGVIIREVCVHCGCGKTTDTWAQRRDTGQVVREVTYEPGKYTAEEISAAGYVAD